MGVDAVHVLFRVSGGGQHKYAMRCLTLTRTLMKRGSCFLAKAGRQILSVENWQFSTDPCQPSHEVGPVCPHTESLPKTVTSAQLNVGFDFFFRNRIGGFCQKRALRSLSIIKQLNFSLVLCNLLLAQYLSNQHNKFAVYVFLGRRIGQSYW